jgi:gamma-glutamyltranspeptidase/glutathione hydrolase
LIEAIERQAGRLQRGASEWEPLQGVLAPGAPIRQRSLGHLIDAIAADGPKAFYAGPVAAAIESAVRAENATLSAADLAAHSTVVRPPIATSLRGATVWGQPPITQAVLGLMAVRALDALEDEDEINRTHVAVEAIEAAFARRDEIALPGAEDRLLAEDLDIDFSTAQRRGGPTVQTHTTAVTTADSDGFLVTMVVSVFDEFGCATLVPEYGFFLNNRAMGFSTDSSSPNHAAPGRRPVHTLSPMLVESDERIFAIATPGADGQVQTLTQLLEAIQVRGMSFTEALDQPRWRSANGFVMFEEGFDKAIGAALAARGHQVRWEPGGGIALFGAAAIAGFERASGSVFAAADLRCDAWAAAC